ncbi:hypothetical protein GUITHDRAFT_117140 [Guillardia theta CCMP2712]|uniref:Uncharacterized protein n=1 Tax=Guillardia theta (strain CCMP2712) TaxID=905079 RepID=L1IKE3_GUITC|nr:hypothetical protein GUITHDRAFT_117140 [Guillardia theta CCMP2712]EKX36711.1 hypothetical protein GUITHDRAFT_117140 [Guillardia theta CCMP2712]|eukprot:XP_005823691.1 hypothetical protein GUITHDRAFT_117140 [Guillardia theta CCMP2712]
MSSRLSSEDLANMESMQPENFQIFSLNDERKTVGGKSLTALADMALSHNNSADAASLHAQFPDDALSNEFHNNSPSPTGEPVPEPVDPNLPEHLRPSVPPAPVQPPKTNYVQVARGLRAASEAPQATPNQEQLQFILQQSEWFQQMVAMAANQQLAQTMSGLSNIPGNNMFVAPQPLRAFAQVVPATDVPTTSVEASSSTSKTNKKRAPEAADQKQDNKKQRVANPHPELKLSFRIVWSRFDFNIVKLRDWIQKHANNSAKTAEKKAETLENKKEQLETLKREIEILEESTNAAIKKAESLNNDLEETNSIINRLPGKRDSAKSGQASKASKKK